MILPPDQNTPLGARWHAHRHGALAPLRRLDAPIVASDGARLHRADSQVRPTSQCPSPLPHTHAIRSYYGAIAAHYEERYAPFPDARTPARQYLLDRGAVRAAVAEFGRGRVLDAGCGTGIWLPYYGRDASAIHLVDLSARMLRLAVRRTKALPRAPTYTAYRGDLGTLLPTLGTYDSILLAYVLGHYPPECGPALVMSLRSLLRPGGELLVVDSLQHSGLSPREVGDGHWVTRALPLGHTARIPKRYFSRSEVGAYGSAFAARRSYMGRFFWYHTFGPLPDHGGD